MSFIRRPKENHCPGIEDFVRPSVDYEKCQECGGRVEVWSDEEQAECLDCGAKFEKKNTTPSCLEYCAHADTCKGVIMMKRSRIPK